VEGELKARSVTGCVLAVGGVAAMPVSFLALGSFFWLYCSAAACLLGGVVLGIRAFAGALLAVGIVGGFCVLRAEGGRTIPPSARVLGIMTPVLLFAGLVILAVSLRLRGRGSGWPWPS
jgi:hypothetical protein